VQLPAKQQQGQGNLAKLVHCDFPKHILSRQLHLLVIASIVFSLSDLTVVIPRSVPKAWLMDTVPKIFWCKRGVKFVFKKNVMCITIGSKKLSGVTETCLYFEG
jgi:hypothetical protein